MIPAPYFELANGRNTWAMTPTGAEKGEDVKGRSKRVSPVWRRKNSQKRKRMR
jgi:hypothetical protein